jgi:hypothetical protein
MSRASTVRVHRAISTLSLITVALFLVATVVVEVVGSESDILSVRRWILGLFVIFAAFIAGAVISGRTLAGRSSAPRLRAKLRRSQAVGVIAAVVFLPCAILLRRFADDGDSGVANGVVLAIELISMFAMLMLSGLNFREGLALRGERLARLKR